MRPHVNLTEVIYGDLGVNLRCCHRRMTQQLLNHPNIRAALQ